MSEVPKKQTVNVKNIPITFENRIVRIPCCEGLDHIMKETKQRAYPLSCEIIATYRSLYEKDLKISQKSLCAEIKYHYLLHEFFTGKEAKGKTLSSFGRSMVRHTEVIDCGEGKVDNNRWVWDLMSHIPFIWK